MSLSTGSPHLADNIPEYTVSELSREVKRAIEVGFDRIRVLGEVSRVSRPRSGHVYLSLRQDNHALDAVIWRRTAWRLSVDPVEGREYVATGRLTTYSGNSRYQLIVEKLESAGEGAILARLEALKAKLQAEGLFDASRKKPLPYLPQTIGVVTSPTGAVIRDILHRLGERFPRTVLIWPVVVQGERCPGEVAAAIEGFNALDPSADQARPDLIIVARGGGSIEDLWGFNEEIVVRAAAASRIPLISAVGHETDTTLIDFAADYRAPTPTAAAEKAVPVRLELLRDVENLSNRLVAAASKSLSLQRRQLNGLARLLPRPEFFLSGEAQRLDQLGQRLDRAAHAILQAGRLELVQLAARHRPSEQLQRAGRKLDNLADRMDSATNAQNRIRQERLSWMTGRLGKRSFTGLTSSLLKATGDVEARLKRAMGLHLRQHATSLRNLARLLNGLGYRQTLERGFAIVRSGSEVVTSAQQAAVAPDLELEFADGKLPVLNADHSREAG